jgi:hypothetical protein
MKRTLFATLALAALVALAASCTPGSPGLGPLGLLTGGTPGATPLSLTPLSPEMRPVTDFAGLVDHLRAAGATVELAGETSNSTFKGTGRIIKVNGGEVQAFEYPDAAAAEADARRISADGSKIDDALVDWPAAPHFYRREKVLAVYVGSDLQVINPLDFVLGRQFAGTPVSGTPGPTMTGTATPLPTATPPGPTAAPTVADCNEKANMLADVTIPDDTVVAAGQSFLKTWRLRNTGTCQWTTGYALAYVKGQNMGPENTPFASNVASGGTVDLSVTLTAPAEPGQYRGNYQLRDAAGKLLPISNSSDGTFWVQIIVRAGLPTPTVGATAPSASPTAPSASPTAPSASPTAPRPTPAAPGAPRISFPAGSTSVTFNVDPPAGGSVTYLLGARSGQEMHIGSGGAGLILTMVAPNGTEVSPTSVDENGLSVFPLLLDGDYSLTFAGTPNQVTIVIPAPVP